MKHIILGLLIIISLISAQNTIGQISIKPATSFIANKGDTRLLEIGDKCPDFVFEHIVRSDKKQIRISDFREKILILDFWSVNCGPCYGAMPKNDLLQKKFAGDAVILPVCAVGKIDPKSISDITKFWNTNKWTKDVSLPTVLDTSLYKKMGVYGVPFEVWINKEGIIIGMTKNLEYLNENEIHQLVTNQKQGMPNMRWRTDFDYDAPLMKALEDEPISVVKPFYSFASRNIPLVSPKNRIKKETDSTIKYTFINREIKEILSFILSELGTISTSFVKKMPEFSSQIDSIKYFYTNRGYRNEWTHAHTFCYEVFSHKNKNNIEGVIENILNDIFVKFQVEGEVRETKIPVIEILDLDKVNTGERGELQEMLLKKKSDEDLIHIPSYEQLISSFNDCNNVTKGRIINQEKFSDKEILIDVPVSYFKDTSKFEKLLYGLGIKYRNSIGSFKFIHIDK